MKFEFREMIGKDRKIIIKMFKKSDIKLTDVFSLVNDRVISANENQIKEFESELNEEDKKTFRDLSLAKKKQSVSRALKSSEDQKLMFTLIDKIIENEHKIDEELHLFLSDLSGISVEEIDNLKIKYYIELLKEFKKSLVKDFFTS